MQFASYNAVPSSGTLGTSSIEFISQGSSGVVVGLGRNAGNNSNLAAGTVAVGDSALSLLVSGGYNTAVGAEALMRSLGNYNVALGAGALSQLTTPDSNIGIGYYAGVSLNAPPWVNKLSSNSVYIGNSTKPGADGVVDEIVIGNDVTGNGSNSVTLGGSYNARTILTGKVGIGTYNPSSKLHISSQNDGASGGVVGLLVDDLPNASGSSQKVTGIKSYIYANGSSMSGQEIRLMEASYSSGALADVGTVRGYYSSIEPYGASYVYGEIV